MGRFVGSSRLLTRLAAAVLPLLLAVPPALAEGIYSYTDEHGTTYFSNRPVDRRFEPLPGEVPPPPAPSSSKEDRWDDEIQASCADCSVEPALVKAIMRAESDFNPSARSVDGAMGLMQLMPETAERLGVKNPYNPQQNIRGAVKYLDNLLRQFGSVQLAAAAYNAGEKAVEKYRGVPPYAETRKYVKDVLSYYEAYRRGDTGQGENPPVEVASPATRIVALRRPDGVTVYTNTPWVYEEKPGR